ncbi:MAG: N2,N2-dimethylguanosine tRNA methyltransferase [Prochlorococcus sp.]
MHAGLNQLTSHYCEAAASLELGDGFFRPDSRPSRDLSVLLVLHQGQQRRFQTKPIQLLDLMSGCGIRALRWALEADLCRPSADQRPPALLWVNDADPDRAPLLQRNLEPLQARALNLQLHDQGAAALLARALLEGRCFDLIDLDAFGCPNALLQPVLQVMAFDGVLCLASSDGRGPTGHDRCGGIRSLGAAARAHPASWELALRLQLGVLARQAWMLGRGIEPLFSFSDGRTFRLAVRIQRSPLSGEEQLLGLLARCEACGAQASQALLNLQGWPPCGCPAGLGRWAVSGPLWLGPLQAQGFLAELLHLAAERSDSVLPASRRLLQRLQADPGLPVCCWSSAELASRLALAQTPPLKALVEALRTAGHQAFSSAVMPGQLRTDATLEQLFQQCGSVQQQGP